MGTDKNIKLHIVTDIKKYIFKTKMDMDKERFYISPETIGYQKWYDYQFIMPTVSVGQVGQLAIDLLLSNMGDKVRKIGVIYSDAILPVIGREQVGKHLCMGLELYESKEHKAVILQQRAPFVKGRASSFRSTLITWIKHAVFTDILVFAGVSSHIRKDAELEGSLFRFLSSNKDLKQKLTGEYNWREYVIMKSDNSNDILVPGSGMLKTLYEDSSKEGINFCGFLMFCNPGNTIHEAVQLVEHMQKFMGTFDDNRKEKKLPSSWNLPGDE